MSTTNRHFKFIFKSVTPIVVLAALAFASPAVFSAQDNNGSKEKTEKTPAMSQRVYKALTGAQKLIEAKKYKEGLAELHKLEGERGLTPYEKAQMYNYFAYTYFTMERYKDAIASYEKVLAQPDLPTGLVRNSLYTLAQLYFIQERYQKAIDTINHWFKVADKPTENAYMLLAQGYYQLKDYKKALPPLKTAYKIVTDRGDKPKENLLLLLRVVYFGLNDYQNMLDVLKQLVTLYPKPEYWLTMAGVYSELKDYKKQTSILQTLYERGDLERGNQELNLANLLLLEEVPYTAAKVLEKGINDGAIKKTVRNLRLLSQAWIQADYPAKAVVPLKEAASMSDNGEVNLRLGQAYINLERYREAVDTLQAGLKKGGIKRPDEAHIMLGMALFELDKYDAAKQAFKEASQDKRSRKSAEQWMAYVQNEQNRKEQLEKSIQSRRK
ncbi:MAG: tetratricopeptide repeat protein [Gammaproteobacteria bacterium]|jgi:tetratricopeptide (TPR) repeat protein